MTRSIRLALTCAALVYLAASAAAQPRGDKQKALELYERGNVQYNLGRWDAAIDLFTKAYEAYPAPEFLFNIAQAHRQAGHCEDAVFFYRRYLANKPDAPNRAEVEGFIKELESGCKKLDSGGGGHGAGGSGASGTGTGSGTSGTGGGGTGAGAGGSGTGAGGSGAGTTGTGESAGGAGGDRVAEDVTISSDDEDEEEFGDGDDLLIDTSGRPRLFTSSVAVGPSFLSAGNLETPVLFSFSIAGGYPLTVGEVQLEPGAVITYMPVPWKGDMPGVEGTAGMTALLANAGASFELAPRLSARGDLGLGVLIVSGLDLGTPFLEPDEFADGPVSMFHMRLALGAEYLVTPNVAVMAQPLVLSVSPGGPLKDSISNLTRFEVLVGAGYRM